jgi:hypothetical protein
LKRKSLVIFPLVVLFLLYNIPFQFQPVYADSTVEYLVVAGGGGGGDGAGGGGGGGGAGGYKTATDYAVTAQAYTITIGAGGANAPSDGAVGSSGNDSIFSTITSLGGGGGTGYNTSGSIGGSGGGGGSGDGGGSKIGIAGTVGQGNNGGNGETVTVETSGGGGGSNAVGTNGDGTDTRGNGGAGSSSSITGSAVTRAGGGGGSGGAAAPNGGDGGIGGGGDGALRTVSAGTAGTANTGGGGGGGSIISLGYGAGGGGSGIVIIRYLTDTMTATGGTITTSGSYTIHTFTTSGTFEVTDIVNPPDAVTDLTSTAIGTSTVDFDWTAPSAGGGGQFIIGYQINVTNPQTSNPLVFVNDTGSTDSDYQAIGLTPGTLYSARVSAWTNVTGGHPLNNATGNVYNFTTWENPDGTLAISSGNIGDTLRLINTITMSDGEPLPLTATAQKVYQNNTLVQTTVISESIPTLGVPVALDDVWYRILVDGVYEYALAVVVTNDAGSEEIFSSSNVTLSREYNPDYLPAVDNPATQGNVNATVERFDSNDGINLKVNRIGVSTGQTWQIECIAQTNSEAAATKDETIDWVGTWENDTNTGYFNGTYTGFGNSHAYITCFNEDELFTLTSFTNSSLALLGIELFDESYGSMLGVPVGVFFLVMTAGMANKRTAPTFIIVVTGIAGTMATIGFFTFDPLVWGLALVTAMLGIFVNQKIF